MALKAKLASIGAVVSLMGCATTNGGGVTTAKTDNNAYWRNVTVYFLMTDRFANGDTANDRAVPQPYEAGMLRGFEGGDIRGVTQLIGQGYFNALGVDAIWTTPLITNVRGSVEEGEWGRTYAYHGYWPLDWTSIDPRFGNEADFSHMVRSAHERDLRVIVDVIINHTGPVTDAGDPRWPDNWVRPSKTCTHQSFATATGCELSFTLQDIRTESDTPVEVPSFLIERWRAEGRLQEEMSELDAFFKRTGYPRAPRYYIIKWLTDWVRDYGIDGFRVDTAKHVEPEIWAVLKREAEIALTEWRAKNPKRIKVDRPFCMFGEVFNFGIADFDRAKGRLYDYGDRQVDFYTHGFDALINMGFPTHAREPVYDQFALYGRQLSEGEFAGRGVLNYIASHDDNAPLDPSRNNIRANATRLMLSPGAVQVYYGDEIGRSLVVNGTRCDATLRSKFDWNAVGANTKLLDHWRRLGRFRHAHIAVGAGRHIELSRNPYVFGRIMSDDMPDDRIVAAIGLPGGAITVPVAGVFSEGEQVRDAYAGEKLTVVKGRVSMRRAGDVVLLERVPRRYD